jgi:hypothetical protein
VFGQSSGHDVVANPPKKVPTDQFDFELMTEAQLILGMFDSPTRETIPDLLDLVTRKSPALSLDRVHSY